MFEARNTLAPTPAKPMPQKGREQLPITNFDPDAEQPSYGEEEENK